MSTPEKEKYLEKLSVQFRGAQVLAQGKYHTWVRRDGEGRRHDGEEKVRVNGCSRSFCVCTRTVCSRGRRGRRRERKESVQGWSSSSLLLSNPLFHPRWNSARAWQDLSGCLPLPCRCYELEHSRSAKWGDWSQLDLWFLAPPPLPPPPPLSPLLSLLPPPPCVTQSLPLPPLPPPPSQLFALAASRSQRGPLTVDLWGGLPVVASQDLCNLSWWQHIFRFG